MKKCLGAILVFLAAGCPLLAQAGGSWTPMFDEEAHGLVASGYDVKSVSESIAGYLKANNYALADFPGKTISEYLVNSGGQRPRLITGISKNLLGAYEIAGQFSKEGTLCFPLFFFNDSVLIGEAYMGSNTPGKILAKKELFIDDLVAIPFDMLEKVNVYERTSTVNKLKKNCFLQFVLNDTGAQWVSPVLGRNVKSLTFIAPGFEKGEPNFEALSQILAGVEVVSIR